ncbi:sigma-70 family RNA polymerase sigma factor [Oscillibacter sp. 1-3]|uniref:sigma-70 family RNA polymerase sigma factor n=1 Tax=Oscillibacter sp. 1-3 TaxID=1235797 RepID=UPI00033CA88F|nr:sigma-70 family RNA polymerase sigma factor [Oscillibacter sp. 1-3]EOS66252.1 sigma-70 family RNA polymerase sigma factor [Oscillibacter sp. 1-3]
MKNWQESRNYRRIKDKDGNIIANIITVDGVDVEVTEDVFLAYSQADRRERYIAEEVEPGRVLSLERLMEDGVPLAKLGIEQEPSAESIVLEGEDEKELAIQKSRLISALSSLNEAEKQLVQALFFDSIPLREYARCLNVQLRTVQYRRDKLLDKLRREIFS